MKMSRTTQVTAHAKPGRRLSVHCDMTLMSAQRCIRPGVKDAHMFTYNVDKTAYGEVKTAVSHIIIYLIVINRKKNPIVPSWIAMNFDSDLTSL